MEFAVQIQEMLEIPLLGLGVYQSADPYAASLAALKHGYRHVLSLG